MKKWMLMNKKADFDLIADKYNISPMLARIIRNRDITDDKDIDLYLNGALKDMHDPLLLKDMDKAAAILDDAVNNRKRIYIIGDYDIDGVCSSFILLKGLTNIGGLAKVRLPERSTDGYGMNNKMVDEAISGHFDVLLTCDNGIAASREIEYAKEKGLTVIITDHHEVPYTEDKGIKKYNVPKADAVVDPKQPDCKYPYKEICGGMVAYKLMQCLYGARNENIEILDELMMFAGFATVGDVMELKDENRIIVKYALEEMKKTSNHGMKCLIDVQNINRNNLAPYHIGFVLGPCINATGRLDSPTRALNMFMSDSFEDALKIANELKSLNDIRKDMTEKYTKEAVIIAREKFAEDKILIVHLPDCHESLAGIIAGRLREQFYKPSFVLTGLCDNIKGSGRSIDAYDMYYEMNKCADLFIKFGGHKGAAGLSMTEDNIPELRIRLNRACTLTEDDLTEKIRADIALPLKYASLKLAKELRLLEPYGMGNNKPLFAQKDLAIKDIKVFGKNRNVVKFKVGNRSIDTIWKDAVIFGEGEELEEELKNKNNISIMYELGINEYMGEEKEQLIIKDHK
ncbi:MAG: single-stranded-DNA-specific exonuclease RecJ [Lachnospiraceae bacterium]|nr:single-stranded-DNA-specific exonuclease RecJ [Lachnospiraceae bacterium]